MGDVFILLIFGYHNRYLLPFSGGMTEILHIVDQASSRSINQSERMQNIPVPHTEVRIWRSQKMKTTDRMIDEKSLLS